MSARSRLRAATIIALSTAVVLTGLGAAIAQAPPPAQGTVIDSCANPVVERDLSGWGRHSGGTVAMQRVAVAAHVSARYGAWLDQNAANPSFYMPRHRVRPGERWTFAVDSWVDRGGAAPTVTISVDWRDANGVYLRSESGTAVPVPSGPNERWTRSATEFTVPTGAGEVTPLARLTAPSGVSWIATACAQSLTVSRETSSPTTPPATTTSGPTTAPPTTVPTPPVTTTPPATGATAAERNGWGTPQWSTEFDNLNGWSLYNDPGNQHGNRQPSMCVAVNGVLEVRSLPDRRTCGMATKAPGTGIEYGRWETRVRSVGSGWYSLHIIWPDSETWPRDGERDWREHEAGAACYTGFIHYPGHTPERQWGLPSNCPAGGTSAWHNVAVEFTPTHIRGYVDGVLWYDKTCDADLCQMPGGGHLTIQNDDHGSAAGKSATTYVDWVRFYPVAT